jgi:hypothetical protein
LLLLLLVLLVLLLLLLLTMMLLVSCRRITGVRVMAIATTRCITSLIPTGLLRQWRRSVDSPSRQIDIDPALVGLGSEVKTQLAADLLNTGLDLLDMPSAMVSDTNNNVQVRLSPSLCITNPHFQDVFGFLNELAVQIDGVLGHPA